MHSFHQSRGRIAFEVLCVLTVSASCAAAWLQSGMTAFLPAAAATGLFGLWHLTDMRRPKAAMVAVAATEREVEAPAPACPPHTETAPVAAAAKPKRRSRKKPPVAPLVAESAAVVAPEARPSADSVAETRELGAAPKFPDRAEIEGELHPPIAPLFEAKPFALQQRPTFGRKAG